MQLWWKNSKPGLWSLRTWTPSYHFSEALALTHRPEVWAGALAPCQWPNLFTSSALWDCDLWEFRAYPPCCGCPGSLTQGVRAGCTQRPEGEGCPVPLLISRAPASAPWLAEPNSRSNSFGISHMRFSIRLWIFQAVWPQAGYFPPLCTNNWGEWSPCQNLG